MSLPLNWPASLDSFAMVAPTQETDDPGFELDLMVNRINTLLMAMEAKLGIGGVSTPALNQVLRSTVAGSATWGAIATAMLAAGAVSQVAVGSATSGGTTSSTSPVAVTLSTACTLTTTGGQLYAISHGTVQNNTASQWTGVQMYMNGGALSLESLMTAPIANGYCSFAHVGYASPVASTVCTFSPYWRVSAGQGTMTWCNTLAFELKR